MKTKQVWRYYCDHCKKCGGQKAAMVRHESKCFFNSKRICTVCDAMQLVQQPMSELLKALGTGGIDALRLVAEGCPACMNAAINQERRSLPADEGWPTYAFDYAAEMRVVQDDIHSLENEGIAFGGMY